MPSLDSLGKYGGASRHQLNFGTCLTSFTCIIPDRLNTTNQIQIKRQYIRNVLIAIVWSDGHNYSPIDLLIKYRNHPKWLF